MGNRTKTKQAENGLRRFTQPPVLLLLLIVTFLVSASIGKFRISIPDILETVWLHYTNPGSIANSNIETALFRIRLPRLIAALIVCSGLSISGASYQGMFKNPMVSPDILGASAGAAFGACVAMLLGLNTYIVQACSFAGGLAAVFLASNLPKKLSQDPILGLVLGGIMVSTLCQAGTSMVKLLADADNKLPQITFWLMGGFNTVNKNKVLSFLLPMALGYAMLFMNTWQLNVLSFGEDEARSLGIKTRRARGVIIFGSTLITASAVSVCGLVGWVGLVVPHIARAMVGPNYRRLLPTCAVVGAAFLAIVDDVARCAFPVELPIGILTSFIGVPFFYFILKRNRRGQSK